MPSFAHVVFPRQDGNRRQLLNPHTEPLYDASQPYLKPKKTFDSAVIDVPLLPGESLPEHRSAIELRALAAIENDRDCDDLIPPVDNPR